MGAHALVPPFHERYAAKKEYSRLGEGVGLCLPGHSPVTRPLNGWAAGLARRPLWRAYSEAPMDACSPLTAPIEWRAPCFRCQKDGQLHDSLF